MVAQIQYLRWEKKVSELLEIVYSLFLATVCNTCDTKGGSRPWLEYWLLHRKVQ